MLDEGILSAAGSNRILSCNCSIMQWAWCDVMLLGGGLS